MDFNNGILRPSHYTSNVSLEFNPAASSGITDHNTRQLRAGKTGANVLTLPYVEEAIIIQPYASRQENVNPFNVFTFIGRIDLVPASDDWTDTRRAPTRVTTIEGDFVATRRRFRTNNAGFAPVQWNAWRTNWTVLLGLIQDVGGKPHLLVVHPDVSCSLRLLLQHVVK